jgi:hypothetical protein
MLRIGANGRATAPDPRLTSGQYCVVVNGSAVIRGKEYPRWTLAYLSPEDPPLEIAAGELGAEAIIVGFPHE